MTRRIVMIACLTAGILLLTGPGWALLALGVLVEVAWPHEQPAWLPGLGDRARRWAQAAREAPRRGLAVALMVTAMVAVPVGVALAATLGAALIVAGMYAAGVSLLLGWNT